MYQFKTISNVGAELQYLCMWLFWDVMLYYRTVQYFMPTQSAYQTHCHCM